LDDLATPFLYVDLDRMSSNSDTMAAAARDLNVHLRPPARPHKVPEIARLQIAAGATGITLAKVSEAEVFADAGIDDLFVAYRIVAPAQLERLVRLARTVQLRCSVDSRRGAEVLSRAATGAGIELEVRSVPDRRPQRCPRQAPEASPRSGPVSTYSAARTSSHRVRCAPRRSRSSLEPP